MTEEEHPAVVTQPHKQPEPLVSSLILEYRQELEEFAGDLRRRSLVATAETRQLINEAKQHIGGMPQYIDAIQEQGPTGEVDLSSLLANFSWTGIVLMGLMVGQMIGYVFTPVLSILGMSTFNSIFTAVLILPAVTYFQHHRDEKNANGRRLTLAMGITEGLLSGFVQRGSFMIYPIAALTPLAIGLSPSVAIGLSTHLANSQIPIGRRVHLHMLALGSGLVMHLILGMYAGHLRIADLLLMVFYTGIGYCALQIQLKHGNKQTTVRQLVYVLAVVLAQLIVYSMLGGARKVEDVVQETVHYVSGAGH